MSLRAALLTPTATAIVYCFCFVALGAGIAIAGPSILQFSIATGESVNKVGYILGLRSLAYLAGGFMGFAFDKVPGHYLLAGGLAVGGIATLLTPLARSLGALAACLIIQGFFLCVIDSGTTVMLLWLMEGNPYMSVWLQSLHFCFAAGAFLAPLALRASAAAAFARAGVASSSNSHGNGAEILIEVPGAYDAAWYAVGGFCGVCAFVLFFCLPPARRRKGDVEQIAETATKATSDVRGDASAGTSWDRAILASTGAVSDGWDTAACSVAPASSANTVAVATLTSDAVAVEAGEPIVEVVTVIEAATLRSVQLQAWSVVINVSTLFAFYVGCEVGFGLFLTAFAVIALGMPEGDAQYMTSAYWGAIMIGRFIAIPLSTKLRASTMLTLDVAGIQVFFVVLVLLIVSGAAQSGVWVAIVLFGLCMASVYPTAVTLLEGYVPLEGKHSTSLVIGGSAGEWFFPFIIASFMQADVESGTAIAVSAEEALRARWVFLGVNAFCCAGMLLSYTILLRLGPALRARREALGIKK